MDTVATAVAAEGKVLGFVSEEADMMADLASVAGRTLVVAVAVVAVAVAVLGGKAPSVRGWAAGRAEVAGPGGRAVGSSVGAVPGVLATGWRTAVEQEKGWSRVAAEPAPSSAGRGTVQGADSGVDALALPKPEVPGGGVIESVAGWGLTAEA